MFSLFRSRRDKSKAAARDSEDRVYQIGRELHERMAGERPGVFNPDYWQGRILEWAMADPGFRVDLFRLIDVLPALKNDDEIAAHIDEYLLRGDRKIPATLKTAIKAAASGGIGSGVAVRAFKKNVEDMARQFIAGVDAKEALVAVRKQWDAGLGFTADLLGEVTLSKVEADRYEERYIEFIEELAKETSTWPANATLDGHQSMRVPRANVSVKVSALAPYLDPADIEGSVVRIKHRVLPLLQRAKEKGVFVNFDMEQWALHEITYRLFEELAEHETLRDWPHMGIVIQAYLRNAEEDAERLLALTKRRGTPITVRLVKGAYWDYEVVHARQFGYPVPVWLDKETTDVTFERLTTLLLKNSRWLVPAIGTHNLRSMAHAIAEAEALEVPKWAFEFQSLHGMAEPERAALMAGGYRVRVYMPFGELLPGMAYLVRRLLENTSNAGFLRLSHHEHVDLDELLKPPEFKEPQDPPREMKPGDVTTPFENAPWADFTSRHVREDFHNALDTWRAALPVSVPVVVGGTERTTGETMERKNPSRTDEVVARVALANEVDVERAVQLAAEAYPAWRDRSVEERAKLIDRVGELLERDRIEIAALQMLEVGKPWAEADADVAEAIDFCHYYARQAMKELTRQPMGKVAGEDNVLFYVGRGPAVVIAPWNFPAAILCGMTTAALVAGNPVIMKPAEQSSAIGYAVFQRMREAGIPEDAVQFLPGIGETVGPLLVEHPDIAQIAFTGSKAVGCQIMEQASVVRDEQHHVKRVVCEMGGKNAIIVDADADLDEAVAGIVKSAFGYAGQKCSACSRVITVGGAHDALVRRLVAASKSLDLGAGDDPATKIPPVVDEEAYERLRAVKAEPGEGAEILWEGRAPDEAGYYIEPALYLVTDPDHRLMQEELFGPIVAIYHAETFDEAIDVANGTQFALTGGVYSRRPSHFEAAGKRFRVGNLYLNRNITGAIVNRQPFGGFKLSGAGTKAGGPSYLLHFCDPQSVTENTMRQGFTPEISL